MPYFVDRTGKRYGRLAVVSLIECKNGNSYWKCRCTCGKFKVATGGSLQALNTRSCGCLAIANGVKQGKAKTTHGEGSHRRRTKVYRIWQGMLRRCLTPSASGYKNYGGRGITVCRRWRKFEAFLLDMGRPPEGCSLDRINNNGPYTRSNCRWSDRLTQASNGRRCIKLRYKGAVKTIAQWAREFDINDTTFRRWIKQGRNLDEISRQ